MTTKIPGYLEKIDEFTYNCLICHAILSNESVIQTHY